MGEEVSASHLRFCDPERLRIGEDQGGSGRADHSTNSLLDPVVEIRPARGQVQHLIGEIRERTQAGERTLVTALTKRLAEDLSSYLTENDIRCRWLHSELDAFERVELLHDLRLGKFDVLVGVNLLREGSTCLKFRWWRF